MLETRYKKYPDGHDNLRAGPNFVSPQNKVDKVVAITTSYPIERYFG